MKTDFTAQVRSPQLDPTEVTITFEGEVVSMSAGDHTIGRWRSQDCSFQRKAPTSYRFEADGETIAVNVWEDDAFRAAIHELRSTGTPLVPRWMALIAATVVVAAVGATAIGAGERPASATIETQAPTTVATAAPTSVPPTTVAGPVVRTTAEMIDTWNQVAPDGAGLELSATGTSRPSPMLTVSIGEGTIGVVGRPSTDADANRRIVAAMGVAVATADPTLEPRSRRALLESLGLDIDGSNAKHIDETVTYHDVEYHLVVVPAESVEFTAEP